MMAMHRVLTSDGGICVEVPSTAPLHAIMSFASCNFPHLASTIEVRASIIMFAVKYGTQRVAIDRISLLIVISVS